MTRLFSFLLHVALILACAGLAAFALGGYVSSSRGVEAGPAAAPFLGTNASLEQYASEAELDRALALVKDAHLTAVRQHFPWREIEATQGNFEWTRWDRIVQRSAAAGLRIVAVLDTAPAWAQRDYERNLPEAPPDDFNAFAVFAREFARRYGSQIDDYEIWDEPNVHPNWGDRNADPAEYGRMLHLAASAIRAQDPQARIILAGLGMNLETQRPHPDYSEILFLRGLYESGFQNDFDVVAAKPYGMWTGPEDRRVSPNTLNFSRVILLRDEMKAHGDAAKPVWAVDMGWNALPAVWEGATSPWGSDSLPLQADRLARALTRARGEWPWMPGLFPLLLQPAAPGGDPRWGFSLLTADSQPGPLYAALAAWAASPPAPAPLPSFAAVPLALLGFVAAVSAWRAARLAPWNGIVSMWNEMERRFLALPEWAQLAIIAVAAGASYFVPGVPLSVGLLAVVTLLFAFRLDIGLALLVFSIPFFLYPKTFGSLGFSPVEILTAVSAAAWALKAALRAIDRHSIGVKVTLSSLDYAVLLFVLLGIVSVRFASNYGVAMREFRVIVIEPALLYALLRLTPLSPAGRSRLVNALLLAGAAVCLVGLAQLVTGDLIRADTIARVRAVWGSPNNAGLFLGRLFPVALAFAVFLQGPRRWLYAALALLIVVVVYFTYSRGALFLGLPAGIAVVGAAWLWQHRSGLRVPRAAWLAGLALVILLAAILGSTARLESLFQEGTGTGFFRVAVWTSALHMIQDHPLLGVGLDNFLYEYPKYMLPEAWREPNLSHPHNVLLDFWVRLGSFGLVVLVWMQVDFFRRAWRSFRRAGDRFTMALAVGLAASMADFLAHGMIDAAYFVVDLAFVFMLSMGLIASLDER
ncbi:MAG: O-antigen ligase family protein [Rudaea sp.]